MRNFSEGIYSSETHLYIREIIRFFSESTQSVESIGSVLATILRNLTIMFSDTMSHMENALSLRELLNSFSDVLYHSENLLKQREYLIRISESISHSEILRALREIEFRFSDFIISIEDFAGWLTCLIGVNCPTGSVSTIQTGGGGVYYGSSIYYTLNATINTKSVTTPGAINFTIYLTSSSPTDTNGTLTYWFENNDTGKKYNINIESVSVKSFGTTSINKNIFTMMPEGLTYLNVMFTTNSVVYIEVLFTVGNVFGFYDSTKPIPIQEIVIIVFAIIVMIILLYGIMNYFSFNEKD